VSGHYVTSSRSYVFNYRDIAVMCCWFLCSMMTWFFGFEAKDLSCEGNDNVSCVGPSCHCYIYMFRFILECSKWRLVTDLCNPGLSTDSFWCTLKTFLFQHALCIDHIRGTVWLCAIQIEIYITVIMGILMIVRLVCPTVLWYWLAWVVLGKGLQSWHCCFTVKCIYCFTNVEPESHHVFHVFNLYFELISIWP